MADRSSETDGEPDGLRVLHLAGTSVDSQYFETLIPALADQGVQLECGTLNASAEPEWLAGTNAEYFSLGARRRPGPWLGTAAVRLARHLRRHSIDIVQTHLFEPGMVGVTAARLARVPVLLTRHHTDEMHFVGTPFHRAADRLSAHGATRVVGFSQTLRQYLIDDESINSAKIDVVPQGFDFDRLTPDAGKVRSVRQELDLEDGFVIGMVARYSGTKGHDVLLRAAAELTREIDNLKVLLVGGSNEQGLRGLVESEGAGGFTVVAGHRGDVPACLGAMDVVVHPSLTETFCQVLIEAMGAGRPLIATDVGAAREVIDDRNTGWLIPPGNTRPIIDAVCRLHRDPDLRAGVAEAGQRSVRQRFPVSRMVSEQLAVYKAVLDTARQGREGSHGVRHNPVEP